MRNCSQEQYSNSFENQKFVWQVFFNWFSIILLDNNNNNIIIIIIIILQSTTGTPTSPPHPLLATTNQLRPTLQSIVTHRISTPNRKSQQEHSQTSSQLKKSQRTIGDPLHQKTGEHFVDAQKPPSAMCRFVIG